MRELIIEHCSGTSSRSSYLRVGYRAHERARQQWRERDFDWQYAPSDRELIRWYLEDYLQCPWGAFKDRAANAESAMARIGIELFEAVFQDETRELYDNVRNDLNDTRIVVHAVAPEGVSLPWELLRDPRREHCDLTRLAYSFTRSQSNLDYDPPALNDNGTFNILLVISRPAGEDDVPFQSVARRLLESVRPHRDRIRVDVLRPPTFEQLSKRLEDRPGFYHALHFDGHGVFPGTNEQGFLVFEGDSQPQRAVSGSELGQLLAAHRLPLVVLNACQSGTTQMQAAYPSVGNQLLQAGVGAVVAMAYSVYVRSAADFMARFYERLAQGQEVARAVHAGRADLFASKLRFSPIGELPLPDWIVPVLFEASEIRLSAPPQGVQLRPPGQTEKENAFLFFPTPPSLGLVGRDGAMLRLERAFHHETVVLLRGMAGVGKTSTATGFARWFAETGGLDGPAFYFSFEHHLTLDGVCDRVGTEFQTLIKNQLGLEWTVQDANTRRDLVLQILKQQPCFLIWDNFEPVNGFPSGSTSDWTQEEQNELLAFLRSLRGGATKVLISSRRQESWLGNIHSEVELGGLNLRESQELAVKVLRRANVNHHALRQLHDYNELLHFLRGNPLAIQAILPELRRQAPGALLVTLKSGEATIEDDPLQGRERSLTASLNYRFAQLDEATQQSLGVLGLFQGFVNVNALVGLGKLPNIPDIFKNVSHDSWISILSAAASTGLLSSAGNGLYWIHPAAPYFLRALLQEELRARLRDTYTLLYAQYSELLQEGVHSQFHLTIPLLVAEEANFAHALSICIEDHHWTRAAMTVASMTHLFSFQGRIGEWERLISSLLPLAINQNKLLEGRELLCLSLFSERIELAQHRYQWNEMEKLAKEVEKLWQNDFIEEKFRLTKAGIYLKLAVVACKRQRWVEAEEWVDKALGVDDSPRVRLRGLDLKAIAIQGKGNIQGAYTLFQECYLLARELQDIHTQSSIEVQLGTIAEEMGDLNRAEKCYSQAQALIGNNDLHGSAVIWNNLAGIAFKKRNFNEAERLYRKALTICSQTADTQGQAAALKNLGVLAKSKSNFREALGFFKEARTLFDQVLEPMNLKSVDELIFETQQLLSGETK